MAPANQLRLSLAGSEDGEAETATCRVAKPLWRKTNRPSGPPGLNLTEPPGADPHAGWCGRGVGDHSPYADSPVAFFRQSEWIKNRSTGFPPYLCGSSEEDIMWEDSSYCWVVVCKNHIYNFPRNFIYRHKIPLAEADAVTSRPPVSQPFRVRCDMCGKEYLSDLSLFFGAGAASAFFTTLRPWPLSLSVLPSRPLVPLHPQNSLD